MKKFILPLILCLIPTVYAIYLYPSLPDIIPIHFDGKGVANDFGSKNYIFLGPGIAWFTWILFLIIKKFDPKQTLDQMEGKYEWMTLLIVLFTSIIGIFAINSMRGDAFGFEMKYLVMVFGGFFIVLGNYMQAMKPNYFMGIRTPWTLENEEVWKKTHHLGGILFVTSGIIMIIGIFIVPKDYDFSTYILVFTMIPAIFSTGYSFWYYQKLKREGKLN